MPPKKKINSRASKKQDKDQKRNSRKKQKIKVFKKKPMGRKVSSTSGSSISNPSLANKTRNVACPICGSMFVTQANVNRHLRTAHSEDRPFHCVACPERRKLNEYLRRHFMSKHIESAPWKCIPCDSMFTTYTSLKDHVYVVHCPNQIPPHPIDVPQMSRQPSSSRAMADVVVSVPRLEPTIVFPVEELPQQLPPHPIDVPQMSGQPSSSRAMADVVVSVPRLEPTIHFPVEELPQQLQAIVSYATELPQDDSEHLTAELRAFYRSVALRLTTERIPVAVCTICKEFEPPLGPLVDQSLLRLCSMQSDGTILTIDKGIRCQRCLESPELPEVVERLRLLALDGVHTYDDQK